MSKEIVYTVTDFRTREKVIRRFEHYRNGDRWGVEVKDLKVGSFGLDQDITGNYKAKTKLPGS